MKLKTSIIVLIQRALVNPLNATGANMHQVPILTENHGIERVKGILNFTIYAKLSNAGS